MVWVLFIMPTGALTRASGGTGRSTESGCPWTRMGQPGPESTRTIGSHQYPSGKT